MSSAFFDAMDDADADAALEKFFEEEPLGLEILITFTVFLSRCIFSSNGGQSQSWYM